jgi:hypothetical protein
MNGEIRTRNISHLYLLYHYTTTSIVSIYVFITHVL